MRLERNESQEKLSVQLDPQRFDLGPVARLSRRQCALVEPENVIAPHIGADLTLRTTADARSQETPGEPMLSRLFKERLDRVDRQEVMLQRPTSLHERVNDV